MINISFDQNKRNKTLEERGLDFNDALAVFMGECYEFEDIRQDYGEQRIICVGFLQGRMVIVGYVQRGEIRHIFSMRKANEREFNKYWQRFSES